MMPKKFVQMEYKVLIAPDKFKGSVSAFEVCHILKGAFSAIHPNVQVEDCPMADGGEGSIEVLANHFSLHKQNCETVDPLGRAMNAQYYTSGNTAYLELASASGLALLDPMKQNPMHTSTYGTGLQIKHALESGFENIALFLGGSATNDGGMGIAQALGYEFYDYTGQKVEPIGESLNSISEINLTEDHLHPNSITLYCDVQNPPFGINGAAPIYAKQKGANKDEIVRLDEGLRNLCRQVQKHSGSDVSQLAGGGAAGGVAICLVGLMNALIHGGMEFIARQANLDVKIASADLVISGEGRLDRQSLEGKVVSVIAEKCTFYKKKLWVVTGTNELAKKELESLNIDKIFTILDLAKNSADAIANAKSHLQQIGKALVMQLKLE